MEADDLIFLVEHEHDRMFAVHPVQLGRQHPAGIRQTPDALLIAGALSLPYQRHAIHREGLLGFGPFLKQG